MRETRQSGSVEGVVSDHDPYSDSPQSCVLSFLSPYRSFSERIKPRKIIRIAF
jgi:hypothetical protein